jgi:hypothetical protein
MRADRNHAAYTDPEWSHFVRKRWQTLQATTATPRDATTSYPCRSSAASLSVQLVSFKEFCDPRINSPKESALA